MLPARDICSQACANEYIAHIHTQKCFITTGLMPKYLCWLLLDLATLSFYLFSDFFFFLMTSQPTLFTYIFYIYSLSHFSEKKKSIGKGDKTRSLSLTIPSKGSKPWTWLFWTLIRKNIFISFFFFGVYF